LIRLGLLVGQEHPVQVISDRIYNPAVGASLHGQIDENLVDQFPAGQAEGDVAEPARSGRFARRISSRRLRKRVQTMDDEAAVHRDRENQHIDETGRSGGIPLTSAASIMRVAFATRSSVFWGIPLAPAAVTTTGSSRSLARSSASMRSREAELSSGRPAFPSQASMPASRIS